MEKRNDKDGEREDREWTEQDKSLADPFSDYRYLTCIRINAYRSFRFTRQTKYVETNFYLNSVT